MNVRGVLGVPGLPESYRMLAGGVIYAAVVGDSILRALLVLQSLADTVAAGGQCVYAGPRDSAGLIRDAGVLGIDLEAAVFSGKITVVTVPPSAWQRPVDLSHPASSKVLERLQALPGRFVVLDAAEGLLRTPPGAKTSERVDLLSKMALKRSAAVMLVCAVDDATQTASRPMRLALSGCGGLAVFSGDSETGGLVFRHWFGPTGPVPSAQFLLRPDDAIGVVAERLQDDEGHPGEPTLADEPHIATRAATMDFGRASDRWLAVDDLPALLDAAKDLQSATLLVHVAKPSEVRRVASVISQVRSWDRPGLKVVVRETGQRLRIAQVVGLQKLGASMVLTREHSGAQAVLMCETLRGTTFSRRWIADAGRVLREIASIEAATVLSPGTFLKRLSAVEQDAKEFSLPHVFVRARLGGIDGNRLGALAARRGTRDVLMTALEDSLWIHLFGCTVEQAPIVLQRTLGPRFRSLALEWTFEEGQAGVETLTREFGEAIRAIMATAAQKAS